MYGVRSLGVLLRHRSHVDDDLRIERQRIDSVVDDWAVMTDDERKQVIQMIFAEIRADHTPDGQGYLGFAHAHCNSRAGAIEGARRAAEAGHRWRPSTVDATPDSTVLKVLCAGSLTFWSASIASAVT